MSRHSHAAMVLALLAALVTVPANMAVARPKSGLTRSIYVAGLASRDVSAFPLRSGGGLAGRPTHVDTRGATRAIVVSPDGRTAYVAVGVDSVSGIDSNRIETYRVGADGALTRLAPPMDADGGPVSLAITPDGRTLYATNRDSGTLSVFLVAPGGRLTAVGDPVPSGALQPQGLAVTPDGRFLFVSHRGEDETAKDWVTRFAVNSDMTLTLLGAPVKIGKSGGSMAITPDGHFLYVPCSNSKEIYAFRIGADGSLGRVPGSPVFAPDFPVSAVVSPDGHYLYATDGGLLSSGSRKVSAFAIGADGRLNRIKGATAGDSPVALTIAPDGRRLYVSNLDSDDVSVFDVTGTGELRKSAGSPFELDGGEQPVLQAIAISPDQGPAAAFTVAGDNPVRLDASRSTDPDGRVSRFDWDLGDGAVLLDAGAKVSHTFAGPGVYTVTLTVTDDEGCSTRVLYTGSSALCNGSGAARVSHIVTVR
jgi:6-phosphogluconolactonase (cycloisomerase 2 family)